MTIRQLQHFLAAADCESFAKAADKLYMTPSALSKSVASLESSLGGQLFERNAKTIELTRAGKLLLRAGPAVLNSFLEMEGRVMREIQTMGHRLSIATTNNHIFYITDLYQKFVSEHPAVEWTSVKVHRTELMSIEQKVVNREVDMGLIPEIELSEYGEGLRRIVVCRSPLMLVVGEDHPLSRRESVSVEELAGLEIIGVFNAKKETLDDVNQMLRMKGLPPMRISLTKQMSQEDVGADDFVFLRVGAGLSVTIIPAISPHIHSNGCVAIPIREIDCERYMFNLMLIYREDNTNPPLLNFLEYAKRAERDASRRIVRIRRYDAPGEN